MKLRRTPRSPKNRTNTTRTCQKLSIWSEFVRDTTPDHIYALAYLAVSLTISAAILSCLGLLFLAVIFGVPAERLYRTNCLLALFLSAAVVRIRNAKR